MNAATQLPTRVISRYAASMDPISMAFYAGICGLLGFTAPRFGKAMSRIAFVAFVGVVAAAALPLIRGMMTGY